MSLKGIGSIQLPEDLASFLNHILREVPAGTVPVHAHLQMDPLDAVVISRSHAYRLN